MTGGDDLLRLRDIAWANHSSHLRLAGDIDRRPMLALMRLCLGTTLGKSARRYWQLADSDDAVSPHGALSTTVLREVMERSDERIEGKTFDLRDGP
ncbi:MAG TPA: hypothetical protein VMV91_10100 [Rhodocyclaceae bacterium]|nr:hypothetical protein [Rhodocyclaceae bacterium]